MMNENTKSTKLKEAEERRNKALEKWKLENCY